MTSRDLFASYALGLIPKILTLQDRNQHSPTFGCFDRNFWHYKIIDFPSGMAQEFVWPVALAYDCPVSGNQFYRKPALRAWVEAGIVYAARNSHRDGSCDDYFPFERAGGAAAFSLLACVESYVLLKLNNPEILSFFERRADWLAGHRESGRLTNHQALIVVCLDRVGDLLNTPQWRKARDKRLARVLEWQDEEGWFQEYEGCDPGYQTLTISLLAQAFERTPTADLRDALERAVRFTAEFIHPDGSFGGEYGSRNTYNFFPHGFEVFGKHMPEALEVNDRYLEGLGKGLAACHADDHIVGHHAWNFLLAWRDFQTNRPARGPWSRSAYFPNAGLCIRRSAASDLYVALNKGGVFRFFRNGLCVAADTQVSLVANGRNAVAHLVGDYKTALNDREIVIRGTMGWAKHRSMTPVRLIILRLFMLCGGRFFSNIIRRLLQRMLITGRRTAPFHFERRLSLLEDRLIVSDKIRTKNWGNVTSVGIGCDQTSIYVVMSRTFQLAQMQPWLDLTERVRSLAPGQDLEITREI